MKPPMSKGGWEDVDPFEILQGRQRVPHHMEVVTACKRPDHSIGGKSLRYKGFKRCVFCVRDDNRNRRNKLNNPKQPVSKLDIDRKLRELEEARELAGDEYDWA